MPSLLSKCPVVGVIKMPSLYVIKMPSLWALSKCPVCGRYQIIDLQLNRYNIVLHIKFSNKRKMADQEQLIEVLKTQLKGDNWEIF